jgi:predicted AAA+ superfamily ATPase
MDRPGFIRKIIDGFEIHPAVSLLGPRQCGKTTLARMYAESVAETAVNRFDLEDPKKASARGWPGKPCLIPAQC